MSERKSRTRERILAAAGRVMGKICRPGIDVAFGERVPGPAFPDAKVHFTQASIWNQHQIGPLRAQGLPQLLTSL
mgnify:CR=1 FL=1